MGKVITSGGLNEFIEKGTVTHVPDHKPNGQAAPLEVKAPDTVVNVGDKVDKAAPEVDKALEKAIETEESVPTLSEESRKYVNKQHRLRREAQEESELSERLSREQYNRAILAEERAKALELELLDLKKAQTAPETTKVEELKFPLASEFVKEGVFDQDAYQKAVGEYNQAQTRKILDQERQDRELAQVRARVEASWDEARKIHTDFDDVRAKVEGTPADMVPQFVTNYVVDSEKSGQVAYFLWTHPEESQRIAKLSPIRGIAELGKLEAKLTAPEAPKVPVAESTPERTGAPPPITPLNTSGAGSVNTDPSKMSFQELRAFEREKLRKK